MKDGGSNVLDGDDGDAVTAAGLTKMIFYQSLEVVTPLAEERLVINVQHNSTKDDHNDNHRNNVSNNAKNDI